MAISVPSRITYALRVAVATAAASSGAVPASRSTSSLTYRWTVATPIPKPAASRV
jgi:hypothetical protein